MLGLRQVTAQNTGVAALDGVNVLCLEACMMQEFVLSRAAAYR